MRLQITKDLISKILFILIILLLLILLVKYREYIYDILYPFIISLFIAYLLNPIVCYLEHKGVRRIFAITIIYIVLIVLAIFICFYAIPVVIRDLGKLTAIVPEYYDKFNRFIVYIQDRYSKAGLPEGVKNVIENNIIRYQRIFTVYLENSTTYVIGIVSKLFKYSLVPILLFYFLKDFNTIIEKSKLIIPRKYRYQVIRISSSVDQIFGSYVRSQIILSLILTVMTFIVLFLLRIEFSLVIGLLNGITNIIPYFGPIIGTIPAVVIAFIESPTKALYTLVAMVIVQQIEADIISPKITGNCVGLHPVTVILVLLAGGKFFGLSGLILAVPVAAALKTVYKDIMKNMF